MTSKSKYSNFFIITADSAACKFCNYSCKYKPTKTPFGLRYHLQTKHDDQYQILTKKEDNEKRSVGSSSSRCSIKRFLPNTGGQIPGQVVKKIQG
ncbi:hypothetical protein ACQ4LE_000953 [Meloidogyne hapla]|uniref:BED-type domain-containing protein n=1 Tax=Meloidogyne hapla TaxID=6305 RepID=A0A1I8B526_MELHA